MDDSGSGSAGSEIVGPDVKTTTSTVEGQSSQTDQNITFMHRKLYEAAAEGDIDTFFTDQKAGPLHLILSPIKNTVLHVHITARCEKKGSTKFVKNILDSCPPLLLQENTKGEIPLHVAARYGDCDIVKVLIEHANKEDQERGIEPVAARDMIRMTNKDKDTAMHEAVRYNHLDVVKLLIKEEDPEFSYSANDAGETPLYLAAERGFEELVLEILDHWTSPAHGGPKGRTALHAAVIQNYTGITKTLLERRGVLTREVDEQGWTPLHHAAFWGSLSMVKLLLDYDEFVAYVVDRDFKRTALYIAVKRRHTNIVTELFSRCPDCCELVDKEGKNVLHYAVVTNSVDAIKFFLESSALTYLIHEKDDNGNTPLHLIKDTFRHPLTTHPLTRNQRVDYMALNKRNMSALDVILSNRNIFVYKGNLLRQLQSAGFKAGRHNVGGYEHHHAEDTFSEKIKAWIAQRKKDNGNQLVVATLIATVTFAAGFTLPGGYIQDQGSAILVRKSAFQAFVVTDSLAMALSTTSVFLHFILTHHVAKATFMKYCRMTTELTGCALIAMVAAFVSGLWAVLQEHSPGLAITTCCMGCLFGSVILLHLRFRFVRFYREFKTFWMGCYGQNTSLVRRPSLLTKDVAQ